MNFEQRRALAIEIQKEFQECGYSDWRVTFNKYESKIGFGLENDICRVAWATNFSRVHDAKNYILGHMLEWLEGTWPLLRKDVEAGRFAPRMEATGL